MYIIYETITIIKTMLVIFKFPCMKHIPFPYCAMNLVAGKGPVLRPSSPAL